MLKPKLTKAEFAEWCDEHARHHNTNCLDLEIHRLRARLDELERRHTTLVQSLKAAGSTLMGLPYTEDA